MTLSEIRTRVEAIQQKVLIQEDDEAAHSLEDTLYVDLLRAIADSSCEYAPHAREALKATEINFARWCA